MKRNAWWLPLLLGGSLAAIYFLPKVGEVAESAVNMVMPGSADGWTFQSIPPSQEELGTLSPDTDFAKAICLRARPGEVSLEGRLVPDRVDISVVLSGADVNNSIHRPERCMIAQGHVITATGNVTLRLASGRTFDVKRLGSLQTFNATGGKRESVTFPCVTYYFFVGHDQITNDHLVRTWIDMKDRLLCGMDQRWAYVSASICYGKLPWIDKEVTEAEADAKLSQFVTRYAENQIHWDQIDR